jgi:hypothetical protein
MTPNTFHVLAAIPDELRERNGDRDIAQNLSMLLSPDNKKSSVTERSVGTSARCLDSVIAFGSERVAVEGRRAPAQKRTIDLPS